MSMGIMWMMLLKASKMVEPETVWKGHMPPEFGFPLRGLSHPATTKLGQHLQGVTVIICQHVRHDRGYHYF